MNRRGFTLVELIAAMVLLSLLVMIIVPTTSKVLKKSNQDVDKTTKNNIIAAAKNWATDNKNNLPKSGSRIISVSQLQSLGYIDKNIKLNSKENINEKCIKITNTTKEGGRSRYKYEYSDTCTGSSDLMLKATTSSGKEQPSGQCTNQNILMAVITDYSGSYSWQKNNTLIEGVSSSNYLTKVTKNQEIKDTYKVLLNAEDGIHSTTYVACIDKKGPEIQLKTVISATNNLTINLTDNLSGLSGYAITSSNQTPTTWTSISGKSNKVTKSLSAGTYYVYAKDNVGNINYQMIEVPKFQFTLTYNYNGATGGKDSANKTVTYNQAYGTLPSPTRSYTVTYNSNGGTAASNTTSTYTFGGWYKESALTNQVTSSTIYNTNGDSTIYAKWTSTQVTLPRPTKTGYTFAGWYSDSALTKHVGAGGAKYTPTSNITLYAKWTINSYTLTVNPNGGAWGGKTTNSTVTQNYNTTKNLGVPTPPAGYTVTYNNNGGTSTQQNSTSTKSFSGWTKTGSGSYISAVANPSVSGMTMNKKTDSDGTYYNYTYNVSGLTSDTWYSSRFPAYTYVSGSTYEIRFKVRVNSSTNGTIIFRHAALANDYGTPGLVTKQFTTATSGWQDVILTRTITGTTTTLSNKTVTIAPVFEFYTNNLKNQNAALNFDIRDIQIINKTNGTIVQSSNNSYLYGVGAGTVTANYTNNSITLPSPTKTGYTFAGWYSDSALTKHVGAGGAKYTPTSNITLYAKWVDNTRPTVSLNPNTQATYVKSKAVTVSLADAGSGLKASQKIYYAWSTSNTTAPSYSSYVTSTNTEGAKTATVTVPGTSNSSLTGTYYLWIKVGTLSDVAGNTSLVKTSAAFKFDNTPPNITSISNSSGGRMTGKSVIVNAKASDDLAGMDRISYKYSGNDTEYNDWGRQKTPTEVEGSWSAARNNELIIVAYDKVGNKSEKSAGKIHIVSQRGWINDTTENPNCKSGWWYIDSDGSLHTGWLNESGKWYYLAKEDGKEGMWTSSQPKGCMMTGWVYSEEFSCDTHGWYFNSSGAMLSNTTVDGYTLNSSGCWVNDSFILYGQKSCDGDCNLPGTNYWNDKLWRWWWTGASSGINRNSFYLNYSTEWVTNYCTWNNSNLPNGSRSSCGYVKFNTNDIYYSRSYAKSSIVVHLCTNSGVCKDNTQTM